VPGFHDIERHADAETVPGLVVYRFDAPIFFANARHLRVEARALVAGAHTPVRWFVLDASAVFDLDVTAAEGLEKLRREFEEEGVVLGIAEARAPMRRMLWRTGLVERIGRENLHPTVGAAVRSFLELHAEAAGHLPGGVPPTPPAVH
jgi:SulP family sulfate permease